MTGKKAIPAENWKPHLFPIESKEMKEASILLSDLIKLNTTNPPGNEIIAAKFCADLLKKEGFENIKIIESESGRGSCVCRWKGSDPNAKSLLLLAHLDVVPADPITWKKPPFSGEIDGEYVWGRGSLDCKGLVASEAMATIILKREGFKPKGDIVLAFTADEEAGGENGVGYLVRNHWKTIKADYIVNEGGGFLLPIGKDPKDYIVQTGEKGVFWTKIRVKGRGGHGSGPIKKKDNAMYKMSKITQKLIDYKSPVEISAPVKEMAQQITLPKIVKKILTSKRLIRPALKVADKFIGDFVSQVVLPLVIDVINPTGFKASEKVNVIPDAVEMTFDCRLLPGHDRNTLKEHLKKALGKKLFKEIEIIPIEPTQPATINSIENPFWKIVEDTIKQMHEGAKLVPMLSAGSTDGKFLRERGSYVLGFSPMRKDPNMTYAEMMEMAHGKNERMWIPNFSYDVEFFYRLVKQF